MSEPESPRSPGSAEGSLAVQRLVLAIVHAVNSSALYPASHPRVGEAIAQLVAGLESLLIARHQHSINLLMVDDDLVVDQQPFRYAGLHLRGFLHAMKHLGVEGLTLSRGLDAEECAGFLAAIAERGTAVSTRHVTVGRVKLAFTGEGSGGDSRAAGDGGEGEGGWAGGEGVGTGGAAGTGGRDGGGGAGVAGFAGGATGAGTGAAHGLAGDGRDALLDAQLEAAREAFIGLRADRKGGLPQLEALVWDSPTRWRAAARPAYPLAPLREPDDLVYVHSVNVALLVLAHAKALGLRGEVLKEIGLAALLHDVGKLSLPPELVVKEGPLDDEEWLLMRRHPELGAARLCALDATTTVAALVAYEHHLRYDGEPSYPLLETRRQPILASQLTAVADTFDSVLTVRPGSRAATRPAALQLLRSRAGTWLDPLLVSSFCLVHEAPAPAAT